MAPMRKAASKVNSPVKKTGQNSPIKKRLLKAKEEELAGGREQILQAARICFARQGFAGNRAGRQGHASPPRNLRYDSPHRASRSNQSRRARWTTSTEPNP
jgi:hypothetical protein